MKYYTKIEQIENLRKTEKEQLKEVEEKFHFRCNEYYMSLIDWDDPDDPIRRSIIPNMDELEEWGSLDPSDEHNYFVMPGMEHKYNSTVLLLVSNVCEGICRYCFRKRLFINPQSEYLRDWPGALKYIQENSEITNVLITGGDPLVLKTKKLDEIINRLFSIEHIKIVRLGTRMPAFNPYRIIDDPDLPEMIKKYNSDFKRIYVMTHFIHPRELTNPAVKSVEILRKSGAVIANQMPLIRGVNDDPDVLAELFDKLSFIGATPYYIFQCRPALGNSAYTVPIEEGYEIIEQAKSLVSGLAKRARFVMSHSRGKIEVLGKTEDYLYLKFQRAAHDPESGQFIVLQSNPDACWLDDYEEIEQKFSCGFME